MDMHHFSDPLNCGEFSFWGCLKVSCTHVNISFLCGTTRLHPVFVGVHAMYRHARHQGQDLGFLAESINKNS